MNSSFIDAVVAAPLGALLCGIQMLSARNDMFSNVFEIAVACIISFIAAGLSSTGVFCYTALVSGGVVLILPVCPSHFLPLTSCLYDQKRWHGS